MRQNGTNLFQSLIPGNKVYSEKVMARVCRLTDRRTEQTRMQTSRQQLVLGRQADRYRASPVNMIAMLCPWHCSMNHWFLPLLNLSSKPYNFCIKSICWSCNYTSPLGVTLDTGNYIWVMRRTILMIRVGQTQRLSGGHLKTRMKRRLSWLICHQRLFFN